MLISGLAITLTPDSAIRGSRRRGRVSIGSAAARSREELEKFEEKERRRKEAVKKEKELLERQVSQLESQARQAVKAENLKEEKGLLPVGRDHVESSASSRHDRRTGHTI